MLIKSSDVDFDRTAAHTLLFTPNTDEILTKSWVLGTANKHKQVGRF